MPNKIIISDASTIIGLTNINHLNLLEQLYGEVVITTIVLNETGIQLPKWIKVDDNYSISTFKSLIPRLDIGEASSIALALEKKNSLLIIDERKGRNAAKDLGLKITGITGIIIRSKNEGLISSGKEKLDELISIGFRLSTKIYNLALEKMGETNNNKFT